MFFHFCFFAVISPDVSFKWCFFKLVNSWTRFVNPRFPKSSGTKDFPFRAWRWEVSRPQTSHCLRFWKSQSWWDDNFSQNWVDKNWNILSCCVFLKNPYLKAEQLVPFVKLFVPVTEDTLKALRSQGISLISGFSRLVNCPELCIQCVFFLCSWMDNRPSLRKFHDAPENLRLTCLIFTIQHLGCQEIYARNGERTWFWCTIPVSDGSFKLCSRLSSTKCGFLNLNCWQKN